MGLFGLGIVTLALFVGLWQVQADYQYKWLIRGYLFMFLHALGFRIEHIAGAVETIIGAADVLL